MNLFILKKAPTSDAEALEMILACAAFEQQPSILLLGSGIQFAKADLGKFKSDGKSIGKLTSAFPMYDIENIFALESDAQTYKIDKQELHSFCKLISTEELKKILQSADKTISF